MLKLFRSLKWTGATRRMSYFPHPVTAKHTSEGDGGGFHFATTSMQGWRTQQEDAHNCVIDLVDGWSLFAVYDGHGGADVAKYAQQLFPQYLKDSHFSQHHDRVKALQKAFLKFDEYLGRKEIDEADEGISGLLCDVGATACVCLLNEEQIIVANIGDSRAVLSSGGKAIELSEDHKPTDKIESERIQKAGAWVTGNGRVNGSLNVSRAFGDHYHKRQNKLPLAEQAICAFPDVRIQARSPDDEYLVVACDGIWNSMTSQEVVDYIGHRLTEKRDLTRIAEDLCDDCLAPYGSRQPSGHDNMTVIIIDLKAAKPKAHKVVTHF
ncbi:unnamed protein product, partial [Mesorhabditis spiculigera]